MGFNDWNSLKPGNSRGGKKVTQVYEFSGFETISPANWGLPNLPTDKNDVIMNALGVTPEVIRERCKNAVYQFIDGLWNPEVGALHHYYRGDTKYIAEFDSGNFLMALNFLVMYDLYSDEEMLKRAVSCFRYSINEFTEKHPMFFWQGGVRDGFRPQEVWVKYSGDAFWLGLALYKRTRDESIYQDLLMFHNFFKRAREAGFKYTFDTTTYKWRDEGNAWRAFGFPVTAYLEFYELTNQEIYLENAIAWGEHGLSLQQTNGAFYLLDGQFWNSDLTAPELRGLVYLWEITKDTKYLDAASRFADWVLTYQREDGAWPLGVDRDGEVCVPTVGPGDIPNIALSLVRLHAATGVDKYLQSAIRAVKYGMSMQAFEGGRYPMYLDDPKVKWGFWSWDPLGDSSLSGDQSIHHIRGMLFLSAYLVSLSGK